MYKILYLASFSIFLKLLNSQQLSAKPSQLKQIGFKFVYPLKVPQILKVPQTPQAPLPPPLPGINYQKFLQELKRRQYLIYNNTQVNVNKISGRVKGGFVPVNTNPVSKKYYNQVFNKTVKPNKITHVHSHKHKVQTPRFNIQSILPLNQEVKTNRADLDNLYDDVINNIFEIAAHKAQTNQNNFEDKLPLVNQIPETQQQINISLGELLESLKKFNELNESLKNQESQGKQLQLPLKSQLSQNFIKRPVTVQDFIVIPKNQDSTEAPEDIFDMEQQIDLSGQGILELNRSKLQKLGLANSNE